MARIDDLFHIHADHLIEILELRAAPIGAGNMDRLEEYDIPEKINSFFKEWVATKLGVLGPYTDQARTWVMRKKAGEGETMWHEHARQTAVLFLTDHEVPLETEANGRITQHIPRAGKVVLMPPKQQHHIPANKTNTPRYTFIVDWQ